MGLVCQVGINVHVHVHTIGPFTVERMQVMSDLKPLPQLRVHAFRLYMAGWTRGEGL